MDFQLRDPTIGASPGGAELVPARRGPAGRVRMRSVDDPGAVGRQGFEILSIRSIGARGDSHLHALDLEDLMVAAGFRESLLLREVDLVVRDDDPARRIDHDLRVPSFALGVLFREPGADVDPFVDGGLLEDLDFGPGEAQPGHRGAEMIAVDGKLGKADELVTPPT